MAKVSFLPAAQADYQDALSWYQARSQSTADRFEAAVEVAVQSIATHPQLYGLLDDVHRGCVLRRFPYVVVYRVDGDDATVVAVAHTRRRPYRQGRS